MTRWRTNSGIVFVSLLAVVVVVVMLIGAFLKRSQAGLFRATHYRDGVRAEQAARAGANHLMALLEEDNAFSSDVTQQLEGASYAVTFDPTEPFFSVNNLASDGAADQTSYQGHPVAPRTADLIVVGTSGRSRRVIRVVFQHGVSSLRSVAAVGRVSLSGDVTVDGVKSLLPSPGDSEPEPAPGGIFSKYRTTNSAEPAIEWSGASFSMSELSRLETAPADTGLDSVSANLRSAYPDQIVDHGAADTIPDIDVEARVDAGMANPALAPGGSVLMGNQFLAEPRSVDGDLTVNGDLIFAQKRVDTPAGPVMAADGNLYVDGDLIINGGISGIGSLYVKGNIIMRGGNATLQTSQPTGTAVMAGGDVTLQGIDAQGYLQTLADGDAAISDALDHLNARLGVYAGASGTGGLYLAARWIAKHEGGSANPWDLAFINPLLGPTGRHPYGTSSGAVPRLARAIKATGLHLSDARAAKIIGALEEMHLHFRDNDISFPFLQDPPVAALYQLQDDYTVLEIGSLILDLTDTLSLCIGPMDDLHLAPKFRTHTSLYWPPGQYNADALSQARRDAYLLYNPLDFSWLGESSFQGLVYARGRIAADTKFKVVGSLMSLSDVTLTNGATLIFNEEYRALFGDHLPIGVRHFEEL